MAQHRVKQKPRPNERPDESDRSLDFLAEGVCVLAFESSRQDEGGFLLDDAIDDPPVGSSLPSHIPICRSAISAIRWPFHS